MHFLTVFWKVLFAFVPPTEYWNGWACFIVSIIMIGVLTAFIGDLASHFGCTIGLKDSVTAVVFVALGTSVPGREYICLMTLSCLTIARTVITNQVSERQEPKGIKCHCQDIVMAFFKVRKLISILMMTGKHSQGACMACMVRASWFDW